MNAAETAGLVTGIVGSVTGVGGLVVAIISERRAARAGTAADAARAEARQARAGADSLEVSLQRIADSATAAHNETNALIAELTRRQDAHPPLGPQPPLIRVTKPEFNVEAVAAQVYRVRNVGGAAATDVDITVGGKPVGLTRGPDGTIALAPMQSTEPFPIVFTFADTIVGELIVRCAQLREPAIVPLPPTG